MRDAPVRILCVEDDADIRELFELALDAPGATTVATCASGSEALRRCTEQDFDVVLLDVMMPGLDGPATLAALRNVPRAAGTAVIFVTAKATRDELLRLQRLGARGVITKPFDPLTLLQRVTGMLVA